MASMRDIKRRRGSIQSTQQITKAMKLVSTVKLQKAKTKAEESQPYFKTMYDTVQSILALSGNIRHPYLDGGESKAKAVIVITSNRGLAGGYNSNVVKLITRGELAQEKDNLLLYTVGNKGRETLERYGYHVEKDYSAAMENPVFDDALEIGQDVLKAFEEGKIGEIYLAYTVFKNTVVHVPTLVRLLPVMKEEGEADTTAAIAPMNFELDEEEAISLLIPKYMNSMIYGALLEASASENGARMQAMDSATDNAEEMIEDLSLQYNRARQGSITQELTEIIAGASAIN